MAPEDERGGGEKETGNLKKEVPVRERLGKEWSTVSLCSESGVYVINASSPGHFFQESGPSSFYLKL